ncbi:MAG: hypothetical protein ACX94C_10610 [Phycisphaerales bacterium]
MAALRGFAARTGTQSCVGFAGGFEESRFDGGAFGVSGVGGLVHVVGGEVGVVGDGAVEGLCLEVGVGVDGFGAGDGDGLELGSRAFEGGGCDDGLELVEGDVVDEADLEGGVGGVEEVVEEGTGH